MFTIIYIYTSPHLNDENLIKKQIGQTTKNDMPMAPHSASTAAPGPLTLCQLCWIFVQFEKL